MNLVVVLEFHQWQKPHPIILSLVGEEMEILFKFLVDPFRLAVSLRVVGGSGCQLNSEKLVEFPGEFCYELGTSIRDDLPMETMMFLHMAEEKVHGSGSRDHCDSGNEMCMLGDRIDNNHDGIVPCRLWQLDNEVHTDGVPWSRWNGKGVDFSGWRMLE